MVESTHGGKSRAGRVLAIAFLGVLSMIAGGAGMLLSFAGYEDSSYPYEGWGLLLLAVAGITFVAVVAMLVWAAGSTPHEGGRASAP